jgi:hypothetical protein
MRTFELASAGADELALRKPCAPGTRATIPASSGRVAAARTRRSEMASKGAPTRGLPITKRIFSFADAQEMINANRSTGKSSEGALLRRRKKREEGERAVVGVEFFFFLLLNENERKRKSSGSSSAASEKREPSKSSTRPPSRSTLSRGRGSRAGVVVHQFALSSCGPSKSLFLFSSSRAEAGVRCRRSPQLFLFSSQLSLSPLCFLVGEKEKGKNVASLCSLI